MKKLLNKWNNLTKKTKGLILVGIPVWFVWINGMISNAGATLATSIFLIMCGMVVYGIKLLIESTYD